MTKKGYLVVKSVNIHEIRTNLSLIMKETTKILFLLVRINLQKKVIKIKHIQKTVYVMQIMCNFD